MTDTRNFSFEFFPPKTPEGAAKLRDTVRQLGQFKPSFFSVTFGAGGSTRERTFNVVKEIAAEGFDAAPHISCIGSRREAIAALLHDALEDQGDSYPGGRAALGRRRVRRPGHCWRQRRRCCGPGAA